MGLFWCKSWTYSLAVSLAHSLNILMFISSICFFFMSFCNTFYLSMASIQWDLKGFFLLANSLLLLRVTVWYLTRFKQQKYFLHSIVLNAADPLQSILGLVKNASVRTLFVGKECAHHSNIHVFETKTDKLENLSSNEPLLE